MKALSFLTISSLAVLTASASAAVMFSQNFEPASPVNYTLSSPTGILAATANRYFTLSNNAEADISPYHTLTTGVYLTGQNMDTDGYSTSVPGFAEFNPVSVTGWSNLQLSISLAGLPTAEVENYVRGVVDGDGDDIYETVLFDFRGGGNSIYIDAGPNALGELPGQAGATGEPGAEGNVVGEQATFTMAIPQPTFNQLRLKIELYNDTDSRNEALLMDNISVSGTFIPEPGTAALGLLCIPAMFRRRRS